MVVEVVVQLAVGAVEAPRAQGQDGVEQHLPRAPLRARDDLVQLGPERRLVDKGVRAVVH